MKTDIQIGTIMSDAKARQIEMTTISTESITVRTTDLESIGDILHQSLDQDRQVENTLVNIELKNHMINTAGLSVIELRLFIKAH